MLVVQQGSCLSLVGERGVGRGGHMPLAQPAQRKSIPGELHQLHAAPLLAEIEILQDKAVL